eukprot:TRINITY_DN3215_c0_g1_i2.p1 TRINITY_DN3215_c0_g1~~TRINITY_DN3215_c0_g1_i2.p1  ORF type:complete len:231 (-),score=58.27 TRINITY_DN3215_c0_g1_i2:46-738(-)
MQLFQVLFSPPVFKEFISPDLMWDPVKGILINSAEADSVFKQEEATMRAKSRYLEDLLRPHIEGNYSLFHHKVDQKIQELKRQPYGNEVMRLLGTSYSHWANSRIPGMQARLTGVANFGRVIGEVIGNVKDVWTAYEATKHLQKILESGGAKEKGLEHEIVRKIIVVLAEEGNNHMIALIKFTFDEFINKETDPQVQMKKLIALKAFGDHLLAARTDSNWWDKIKDQILR